MWSTIMTIIPYIALALILYAAFRGGIFLINTGAYMMSGNDVRSYQEIKHSNRLGGLVRNPNNNELEPYNEDHPLWMKK